MTEKARQKGEKTEPRQLHASLPQKGRFCSEPVYAGQIFQTFQCRKLVVTPPLIVV
jgi:hypothetical protein